MASGNAEFADAFASNELVGDRPLIAKPAPPAGLLLNHQHPLRKAAPMTQQPAATIASNPIFKKAPVRMLGNMVCSVAVVAVASGYLSKCIMN